MARGALVVVFSGWLWMAVAGMSRAEIPKDRLELTEATRDRCRSVLQEAFASDEFWPSMHAAEALSMVGQGSMVRQTLAPRVKNEPDDQKRCGLARELVRAGDLSYVRVLSDVLAKPDPYGHVHASESLFKIWQVGEPSLLRKALARPDSPKLAIMSAAALARWGHPGALKRLRDLVRDNDQETARLAAWVLARVGDASDIPALRAGAMRFPEPLSHAYFEHAMAALGDPGGLNALVMNLSHDNPDVRVYAAEFAPEARAIDGKDALTRLLDDPVLDVRIRAAEALLLLERPAPPDFRDDFHVDVFQATEQNPRYTEGSVLVLRDGRLLYAATEFEGSGSDFARARIIGVTSDDHGRTWSPPRVLQENVGGQNVMSVTLRRLSKDALFDGPIGMFYLVKNNYDDLQVHLRISNDEGATFGDPIRVTADPGYHVLNNDRVTRLSSGRLIVPVASTPDVRGASQFQSVCYLSDDAGLTWRRGKGSVSYPKRGAMEPEVLERKDGRLLMHFRTQMGHIAACESSDGGETWSEPRSLGVRAPEAPSTLRRIPSTGDLLLIWNDTFREGAGHGGKRTPLTAAVSTDEGRTWSHRRDLETNDQQTYAYTSVVFDRGRALMTYWVRDEKSGRFSSRFRSVPIGWFYEQGHEK